VADHNTYIRAEFLRSAFSMLDDNFIFGLGFGTPYRDPSYDYLHWHPFLVWEEDVRTVTNHNSVFDAYFRFGLIFGTLFLMVILRYIFSSYSERGAQIAAFLLAMGVSFNAFMENSNQMPVLCFLLAYLRHEWLRQHCQRDNVSYGGLLRHQTPVAET
jgi:O-antigen ligase